MVRKPLALLRVAFLLCRHCNCSRALFVRRQGQPNIQITARAFSLKVAFLTPTKANGISARGHSRKAEVHAQREIQGFHNAP